MNLKKYSNLSIIGVIHQNLEIH